MWILLLFYTQESGSYTRNLCPLVSGWEGARFPAFLVTVERRNIMGAGQNSPLSLILELILLLAQSLLYERRF